MTQNLIPLDLFVKLAFFLITGLLGIVIYFIKNFHASTIKNMEENADTLAEVKEIITEQKVTLSEFRDGYRVAHFDVVSDVKGHTDQLNNHENRLTTLESECHVRHKSKKI